VLRRRPRIRTKSLSQVDFVVFSGDVAWQGNAEEYQAAREFLFDPVLKALALSAKDLFIVPGNHDLSREHVQEMLPEGLRKPFTSEDQVQKWLTDEKKRKRAFEPFDDFADFVSGFTGQKPAAYANIRSQFFGDETVGILCLNSAWMCGRNLDAKGEVNDYGYLTVGEPQIHEALAAVESADVRLAVLHHPFPWLAEFDRNRIEERLKQVCHFILHGHEHEPDFSLNDGLFGECAIIPAGLAMTAAKPQTRATPTPTTSFTSISRPGKVSSSSGAGVTGGMNGSKTSNHILAANCRSVCPKSLVRQSRLNPRRDLGQRQPRPAHPRCPPPSSPTFAA